MLAKQCRRAIYPNNVHGRGPDRHDLRVQNAMHADHRRRRVAKIRYDRDCENGYLQNFHFSEGKLFCEQELTGYFLYYHSTVRHQELLRDGSSESES
uniref:Uncharacterized protein n=1 Tax=Romanomermis culicivorax TaxID=13658 RepID=A0A915ITQ6_ROMCU